MTRTKSVPALARGGRIAHRPPEGEVAIPRLPDDLGLDEAQLAEKCRRTWHDVTDGETLIARLRATPVYHAVARCRKSDRQSDPLYLLARILLWLARRGWSEARLRRLLLVLDDVLVAAFSGAATPSIDQLDAAEAHVEGAENERFTDRRIRRLENCSPDDLRAEASLNRDEAAISLTRARVLERHARRLEAGLVAS